ncbi:MAG: hypothetical protein QXU46_01305 [Candidatus Bathyarchaeia archaeon]
MQINGEDVNWGDFSNGDTGHAYSIYFIGTGSTITFRIVDWIDEDYTNNECHLPVEIYELPPKYQGLTPASGRTILMHGKATCQAINSTQYLQTME